MRLRLGWRPPAAALLAVLCAAPVAGFLPEVNGTASTAIITAYYDGFTGMLGSAANPNRYRVNPGSPLSLAQPNIYEGVIPRREWRAQRRRRA